MSSRRIPAFPGGKHWYTFGETSSRIKIFQDQMHKRGFFPVGTGQYGPNTRRMVEQLQRLNGLVPNGFIGPNTWRLAWTGRYSTPGTGSAPKIPAFPGGKHWYTFGETSSRIKIFQDQMHKRGFFPVGTGQYGPNTRRMVEQLQRLNGLVPNGFIGPNTWRLAWVGTYHDDPRGRPSAIAPFPGGSHWYGLGETSWNIKTFQDQMHKRGFFPVGTATAAGVPGAAALFADARRIVTDRFWDPDAGRCVERYQADWSSLEAYRGANSNMHQCEAFLAAGRVSGDPAWHARAESIARAVIDGDARRTEWRVPEHFDPSWRALPDYNRENPADPFRPYGATVGHWFEWARLLITLDQCLPDPPPSWLVDDAAALFDKAVAVGWPDDGAVGIPYTFDWADQVVVDARLHWVICEAVLAADALYRRTGQELAGRLVEVWWSCIERFFADPDGGSWWHEVDATGRPAGTIWAGKPDVYHAYQAVLLPDLPLGPRNRPGSVGRSRRSAPCRPLHLPQQRGRRPRLRVGSGAVARRPRARRARRHRARRRRRPRSHGALAPGRHRVEEHELPARVGHHRRSDRNGDFGAAVVRIHRDRPPFATTAASISAFTAGETSTMRRRRAARSGEPRRRRPAGGSR